MKIQTPLLLLASVALLTGACGSDDTTSADTTPIATVTPSRPSTSVPTPTTGAPTTAPPTTGAPTTAPPTSGAPTTAPPTTTPTPPPTGELEPSATPFVIDNYPVLDPEAFPAADGELVINGGWTQTTGDYGWIGLLGVPATDAAPTMLTQVQVMPISSPYAAATIPGRRADVRESSADDITSIVWEVDESRFVATGPDADALYALVDLLAPVEATDVRGGYEFTGGLPADLVELDAPRRQVAGWFPGLLDANEAARLTLYMTDQSPLQSMVQVGGDIRPVTVGGYPGFISTRNGSVVSLAFAVAGDETVQISYSPYTADELLAIVATIEFTDEDTWREHYGVDWGNGRDEPATTSAP